MIIDTLKFQLAEKEKLLEKLECEIVGLRKEIEKTKALNLKFFKGSKTLDEIINVQRSPLLKTGPMYSEKASQASTSKSYLDVARRNEQKPNGDHQILNPEHYRNKQMQLDHHKIYIRYLNNLKLVWSSLCIRSLHSLNLRIYVPSLH